MRERATANDVPFTPLDKLFEPTVPQGPELPAVDTLPVEALRPFSGHPFHLYTDEKLRELTDSIREHGVLMPVLVRLLDGGYEIVSGHNRVEAAKLAGLDKVPVTVRELDDDTATILMVDSNLQQREKLLPSERAWAYRMKLSAMNHQGRRVELTCSQLGNKLERKRSSDLLAEEEGLSKNQIFRFIRLTELIPPFLDMVDNGRLAFNPAVELSYLSLENQTILFSIMERDELSPSLAQAQNLHKLSSLGKLDESAIEAILLTEPVLKKKVTLKVERIAPYFPRGTNPEEMEVVILRLLASWQRSREQKRAHENSER